MSLRVAVQAALSTKFDQQGGDDFHMAQESREQIQRAGFFVDGEPSSKPEMHESLRLVPDGTTNDLLSVYSTSPWGLLLREEWYRMKMKVTTYADTCMEYEQTTRPMFHGTEWGSAVRIAQHGFIVGPGTHGVRGKSWSGCWCVPDLSEALQRSDPRRYADSEDYNRFCCPVVLEVRCARLRRVPGTTKHVCPGDIGVVLDGVEVAAIHFNVALMKNFLALELPLLRARLQVDSFHVRRCGCNICGRVCLPETDEWHKWERSNKGIYYTPRCAQRCRGSCMYVCFN
jgi:hypothetical protein